ncbi:hypothetical protein [Pseudoalteromonas citrea]|nr:hypothetical protein [Pseudoalteromonas citrea]
MIILLAFTALLIASNAAYFSIIGLAAMFSASYWPVVFMGISLEAGKLVATSYVYRAWSEISIAMRTYLMAAIALLMLITSLGIFGFLSHGYGASLTELHKVQLIHESKQVELNRVLKRIDQVHSVISSIPVTYITKRMELQAQQQPLLDSLARQETNLRNDIVELNKQILEVQTHIGPILYIADMFNLDQQEAVKYFIFAIVLVFDPLAVILVLATNCALSHRHSGSKKVIKNDGRAQNSKDYTDKPASIPKTLAATAKLQKPSINLMESTLSAIKASKGSHKERVVPLDLSNTVIDPNENIVFAGAKMPKAVLNALSEQDQALVLGVVRGMSLSVLAGRLSMKESEVKQRCEFIAQRLFATGYTVNVKSIFV